MCQSYSSGLCGEQIPHHDMGEMPSARATPPDVAAVLAAMSTARPPRDNLLNGSSGIDNTPNPRRREPGEPTIHYGTPGGAFLVIACQEEIGYVTDKLGLVTCTDCLDEAVRLTRADTNEDAETAEAEGKESWNEPF